jgi:hypothetical protein
MGNLLFLGAAIVVIALGILVLAVRAREPKGFDAGIKAHQRHMSALSTETRRDSTGIDRIQPVRRVSPDPENGTGAPQENGADPGQNGAAGTGPQDSSDAGGGQARRPGTSGGEG